MKRGSGVRGVALVAVCLLAGATACGDDDGSDAGDGGTRADGGGTDGSLADAGPRDATPLDAGARDVGAPDATPGDAGAPDGGPVDAGPADAGPACELPTAVRLGGPLVGARPYEVATLWTGDAWLHVQPDYTTADDLLLAARVSRDGVRAGAVEVDRRPRTRGAATAGVTAAWTGTRALVGWVRTASSGNTVYVARVGADGTPEAAGAEVLAHRSSSWLTSVWTGSQLGLVLASSGVRLLRLDADGAVLGAPTVMMDPYPTSPAEVAFNGLQYGIAWESNGRIWFARVATDGIAEAPVRLSEDAPVAYEAPIVLTDGDEWIVAFADRTASALRLLRLAAGGAELGHLDVPLTDAFARMGPAERAYDVALEPSALAITYVRGATTQRIDLLRVNTAGAVISPEATLVSHADAMLGGPLAPDLVRSDVELALAFTEETAVTPIWTRYVRSACPE